MSTVAIIGRPNVGKSTLFNRLTGKRQALVDNTPGVTRDRRMGAATLGSLAFTLIDTAGLEEAENETLEAAMMQQTERATEDADVLLMMVDARAGITPLDEHFARWARKKGKPTLLLVNKCEARLARESAAEAYSLGLGDPLLISAEHGEGLHELFEALAEYIEETEEQEPEEGEDGPVRITIAGRPNVGKSTLLNQLLGQERSITGPQAGITRDAIHTEWSFEGRPILLVDTAGIRRKSNVTTKLEKLSVADSLEAIKYAHIVILLVDGTIGLDKQELTLADHITEEGRGMIVAVNKWDAVKDKDATLLAIRERLEKSLPQLRGVKIVTLSALQGKRAEDVIRSAFALYDTWNTRIPTGQLNRWMEGILDHNPPPLSAGRRVKIKYITQTSARPPAFALFTSSNTKNLKESYIRFLKNDLRENFGLDGIPLRLNIRKKKNPFVE